LHAALAERDEEVRGLQQATQAAHADEEARATELEGWVDRWREANEALKEELARAQSALADRDQRIEALEEESHAHRCDAEARGAVLEQSEAELEQLRGHLRAYENRLRELERQVTKETASRLEAEAERRSARDQVNRLRGD
jgi:chromosome segregation ATPase